jgi:hypothetical protein
MPQLSVYVARGILIESKKPTWLYGTASEHSTFYQYSFHKAEGIHAGMIQTESPYYQPNPLPPIPFSSTTAKFAGDPDFGACSTNASASGCDSSWSVRIERSANISIAGAGLYSWFNIYDQSCVDIRTCQKSLVDLKDNGKDILFLNLITIGAKNMVTTKNGEIDAATNELNGAHPKWSHIAALQVSGDLGPDDPVVYIGPTVWIEPSPTVQCSPPCILVLPPSVLPSETTISIPPYVTSLEIGWTSNGVFTASTITTTLSIPPITTATIDFSNVQVNSSTDLFAIIPTVSIMPQPFVITDSYPPGITNSPPTRTITPPPYPFSGSVIPTGVIYITYVYDGQTIYLNPNQTITTTESGHTIIFLPTGIIVDGNPPIPPPTSTPTTIAGITIGPPPPPITTFPISTVQFVTTDVPKPTTTKINGKTEPVIPCWAWFFFICTDKIKGIVLFGFEIPGIYPRGGPPPLPPRPSLPPGIDWPPKIEWPPITIGLDGTPSFDPMEAEDDPCETETSSICSTTISQDPTTTITTSTCQSVSGCAVTGSATATTTSACKLAAATPGLSKRANTCGQWAIVVPRNNGNQAETDKINKAINDLGVTGAYRSSSSQGTLGTLFWAIERMTDDQMQNLRDNVPEVSILHLANKQEEIPG